MDKLQGSRIIGGNTAYKRVESDYYPTPPEVTQALCDTLHLPKGTKIWEPAAGEGYMVDVLKHNGYDVTATDIQSGVDFLTAEKRDCEWIITNPPFSLAEQFIERCNKMGVPFALLLKAHFWNAKRRYNLFCHCPPSMILPLTWRPDFMMGKRGGGSPLLDVCWCVWDRKQFKKNGLKTLFKPIKKPETEHDSNGSGGQEG